MDVISDGLPKVLEDTCRSCEVNTCKIFVFENHITGYRATYVYKVDNAVR